MILLFVYGFLQLFPSTILHDLRFYVAPGLKSKNDFQSADPDYMYI